MQLVRQIPKTFCLNCCAAIVAAAGGNREPREGDILSCHRCGYLMELSSDLVPHMPSAAARSEIASMLQRAKAH